MRGVFIGRFQPPHMGHFLAIKWCFENTDIEELIIVVGSAQRSHTIKDPFTAGERIEMLRLGLKELGIDLGRVIIIPVPDIAMNNVWVRYLEMLLPRFEIVFSRNPLVVRLFEEYGYKVIKPPSIKRDVYMATYIRELMLRSNQEWMNYVPKSVAEYIVSIEGHKRLLDIAGDDR